MDITSYLRGYCEFEAAGFFPERFINLTAHADLGLWDIKRSEGGITAKIIASRYKKLLAPARKSQLRLRLKSKHGLPFRLLPYRRRAGMPLGFIIFCGLLWLLSQFYWIVELPQVSPGLQGKLEAAVYDAGIRPGVLRSQVDAEMISRELQIELDELSWAGITAFGSSISVDVRELDSFVPEVAGSDPCNVIASKSGIIISIRAAEGQPAVAVGETVAQGDLLISGVMELSGGSISMVHAHGEVTARTFYELKSEIPFEQHRTEHSGRLVTIRRLMLLGIEIPLYFGSNPEGAFEREYDEWQLRIADNDYPLILRTERWYETRTVNRIISPEEAEALARADIEKQLDSLGDIEILETTEAVHTDGSSLTMTMSITACEDIALAELILFE